MIQLEQRLQQRFPHWFRGRRGAIARPLLRRIERWSRLDVIDAFLAANRHVRGFAFVAAALQFLDTRYDVDEAALTRIPAKGRLLIIANHPSGALDALALLDAIGRVRRDVRVVANDFLSALDNIEELLLPVRIQARNSALFYGASALFKAAGTALLAREMFARRARRIALRIGKPRRIPAGVDGESLLRDIRRELYALGTRRERTVQADENGPDAIGAAVDPALVRAGVESMRSLGETGDGKQIRVGTLSADAPLLREIGRLREVTFRAVGEGTGRSLDLDAWDSWYEHIVLWDDAASRIAGAYRIARGAPMLAAHGVRGLYTASLFDYADDAIARIAQGMELGRSFVAQEYWGSRSIDYLWQGIGAYLRAYPKVRYLFGAVSISAALPVAAREQIAAHYAHYFGAAAGEVASRRPFAYHAALPRDTTMDADTAFRVLRANLDALGAQVPMLYKQYTELCEPGGARFLAFGVDPDFSDAVDGLIEVDIDRMRPKKRQRYLGEKPCEAVA